MLLLRHKCDDADDGIESRVWMTVHVKILILVREVRKVKVPMAALPRDESLSENDESKSGQK